MLDVRELLVRIKDTGRQVGRSREERLKAMEGAFRITPHPPLNLRGGDNLVLLIDDVWTTGATMRECTKVLKTAGIKKVWGLCLAR
jgi:predicted amidophosphoribosyltransferase